MEKGWSREEARTARGGSARAGTLFNRLQREDAEAAWLGPERRVQPRGCRLAVGAIRRVRVPRVLSDALPVRWVVQGPVRTRYARFASVPQERCTCLLRGAREVHVQVHVRYMLAHIGGHAVRIAPCPWEALVSSGRA